MDCSCSKDQKIDLSVYGITDVPVVYRNLSYDELFVHETAPELKGYEKGFVTSMGAVNVDTGIFTGRSPKDKSIVLEEGTEHTVHWGSVNQPMTEARFEGIRESTEG